MRKVKDRRSPEATEYIKLYKLKAWRDRRLAQLTAEPLCRFCKLQGTITPATVADHIEPHRGDLDLFWFGELQSLCHYCHAVVKQRIENGDTFKLSDADGYPIDLSTK